MLQCKPEPIRSIRPSATFTNFTMASEDVIELGSSEDEAEPAPKKMKPKPKPNAMVLIPNKLPGLTIKPAKTNKSPIQKLVGKGVTVTKVVNPVNIQATTIKKTNGRPSPIPIKKNPPKNFIKNVLSKPIPIASNSTLNPLSLMRKLTNSQVVINKLPSTSKTYYPNAINVIKVQTPIKINRMAPMTITKTPGGIKRPAATIVSNVRKKPKASTKIPSGEVLTVELDDDDVTSSPIAGPQWYLRPEDQKETENIEKKNNAEPAASNLIEITIEDSPIKPKIHNKQTHEVGAELSITIEDSPAKSVAVHGNTGDNSDNETIENNKVPHSKKKLEYPKKTDINMETSSIEIEVEPMEGFYHKTNNSDSSKTETNANENIIEVADSPLKNVHTSQTTPTKKKEEHPRFHIKDASTLETPAAIAYSEFHPVYQSFIDLCFKLEDSDDMKKIVEKKIKAYYKQVPKVYAESEDFIDMVSSKVLAMKASPEKMYLYIKDIVDELNLQRKMAKSQFLTKDAKSAEEDKFSFEDSEFDSKRQRQIRKLEKTLKKLHRAIQKLEEQEVDFDDEEDSVYLLTERYKERMVRVHAKFCQLTNTKMPSEPRVLIDARPGRPSGPAKRLEKWVNKKVPIGTPLPFPDFHDVLRCVREANGEEKLGWNEADIMEEARDLFTRCGKKLQRRRQENEWRLAVSRISSDMDPAEISDELKKKLEHNLELATKKETDVFNKYADRQSQLKLEAVEIEDKEADESPEESDDEPAEEAPALEDKEKRKERLKRLIQEKTKKDNEKNKHPEETEKGQSDIEMVLEEMIDETKEDDCVNNTDNVSVTNADIEPTDTVNEENKKMEVDVEAKSELSKQIPFESKTSERVHSISDDDGKVDSDVDELHLLQKLHSGNEVNSSTVDSSDTDTPINISDTLPSSSDNRGKVGSDVISIENSSYSESETGKDTSNSKGDKMDIVPTKKTSQEIDSSAQKEYSPVNTQVRRPQSNNGEYNDPVENILLASSDDEVEESKNSDSEREDCVNLKDDAISITDTFIQGADNNRTNENFDVGTLEVSENNFRNVSSEKNIASVSEKPENCESIDASSIHNNLALLDEHNDSTNNLDESRLTKVNSLETEVINDSQLCNNITSQLESQLTKEDTSLSSDQTKGLDHSPTTERINKVTNQTSSPKSNIVDDDDKTLEVEPQQSLEDNDISEKKHPEEPTILKISATIPVESHENFDKGLENNQNDTKDHSLSKDNTEQNKDKIDSLDSVLKQLQSDLE